jgi:hypothetical protein
LTLGRLSLSKTLVFESYLAVAFFLIFATPQAGITGLLEIRRSPTHPIIQQLKLAKTVRFTVAKKRLTFPAHLRIIFEKIYANQAPDENGWEGWQRVLQVNVNDPAFLKRLATVQRACRLLRTEVSDIPRHSPHLSPSTTNSWLHAIDRLTTLTIANNLHHRGWKTNADTSDISALDTLNAYYEVRQQFIEIDVADIANLVGEITSLIASAQGSGLDDNAKRFFINGLEELKFFLENIEIFGFEGAWSESANLVGGVLRFRNELHSEPHLRESLRKTAWRVMQFLAVVGGAKDGAVLFADAAQALLGSTPAF